MEDIIVANSEQICCIARELEAIHDSLRKMQYLLAENNDMCMHLGFVGAEPSASELEHAIQDAVIDYQKLWHKLAVCSEQYMKTIKTGIPTPPPLIFPNFKI